jgi:hypothetical protein
MKESGGNIMRKLKPVIGHFTGKITPEMWAQFEEAAKRPIVFDEEMPELTEEDMARFHPVYKRLKKAEKRDGVGAARGHGAAPSCLVPRTPA